MMSLVARGVSLVHGLLAPYMLVAVPCYWLVSLLGSISWRMILPTEAFAWTAIGAYLSFLAIPRPPRSERQESGIEQLVCWLFIAAAYVGVAALGSYGAALLRTSAGDLLGAVLFAVVSWLAVVALFVFCLAPILATRMPCSGPAIFVAAGRILLRNWRGSASMLTLFLVAWIVYAILYFLIPWSRIPWLAARPLVLALARAIAAAPAVGMAVLLVESTIDDGLNQRQMATMSGLPAAIRLVSATIGCGLTGAALHLLLLSLIPIQVLVAATPGWPPSDIWLYVPGMFPGVLLLLVCGILTGWAAERAAHWRWIGAVTGMVYGTILLLITMGMVAFHWPMRYVAAVIIYAIVGLTGGHLSFRCRSR